MSWVGRMCCVVLAGAVLAGTARAERVYLRDGGAKQGRVTDLGDRIRLDFPGGTVILSKADVVRIEPDISSAVVAELKARERELDTTDADARFELGLWAEEHGLIEEAHQLWKEAVGINPDHAGARRRLNYVRCQEEWLRPSSALERVRGLVASGRLDEAATVLAEMEEMTLTPEVERERLQQSFRVAMGRFEVAEAVGTLDQLVAGSNDSQEKQRLETTLAILKENPDGMFLVVESDSAASQLFGEPASSGTLQPGMHPLTDEHVWKVALRETARDWLDEAGSLLLQAKQQLHGGSPLLNHSLREADALCERADAVAPGVARAYLVEGVGLRIASLRESAKKESRRFDAERESLRGKPLTRSAYVAKLQRLIRHLITLRGLVRETLEWAGRYPEEYHDVIETARMELDYVEISLETLWAELAEAKS